MDKQKSHTRVTCYFCRSNNCFSAYVLLQGVVQVFEWGKHKT